MDTYQHLWALVDEHRWIPLCPHVVGRAWRSGLRALIPLWDLHTHPHPNLMTSQRPHLQILSHWGLGLQHVDFREQKLSAESMHLIPKCASSRRSGNSLLLPIEAVCFALCTWNTVGLPQDLGDVCM